MRNSNKLIFIFLTVSLAKVVETQTRTPGLYPGSTGNYCSLGYCLDCEMIAFYPIQVSTCKQCKNSNLVAADPQPVGDLQGQTIYTCDGTALPANCATSIYLDSNDTSNLGQCGNCNEGFSGTTTCSAIDASANCAFNASGDTCNGGCLEGYSNDNNSCSLGTPSTLIANCKHHGWDHFGKRQICYQCDQGFGQNLQRELCVTNSILKACDEVLVTPVGNNFLPFCKQCNWRLDYFAYGPTLSMIKCHKWGQQVEVAQMLTKGDNLCNLGGTCAQCSISQLTSNSSYYTYCSECVNSKMGPSTLDCTGGAITEPNCKSYFYRFDVKGCFRCEIGYEPYEDGIDTADNNKKLYKCRATSNNCQEWEIDFDLAKKCVGCAEGMVVNSAGTDCEAGGHLIPNCELYKDFNEYGGACRKCQDGFYWDGHYCTKSVNYAGGNFIDGNSNSNTHACYSINGWTSSDNFNDKQATCENPTYTAPPPPSSVLNHCTSEKCIRCGSLGDHLSCEYCANSVLTPMAEIFGNQINGCSGTSTGIENCRVTFNPILDFDKAGCRICENGFAPTKISEISGKSYFECMAGTITGCLGYGERTSNSDVFTCLLCPSDLLLDNNNCSPFGSETKIPNCLSHEKAIGQLICLICEEGFGIGNGSTLCFTDSKFTGCAKTAWGGLYGPQSNTAICYFCNSVQGYFSTDVSLNPVSRLMVPTCSKVGAAGNGDPSSSSSDLHNHRLTFMITLIMLFFRL